MKHLEDAPDLMTPEEARHILRLSRNRIYSAIADGDVPSIRMGKKLLVPKKGIISLIARATQATGSGDTAPC